MSFYQVLESETAAARRELLDLPIFQQALEGRVTVPLYCAFLAQAFHHVRHTVPLMMACGARLGPDHEWLRGKLVEYIEEEFGHQEWILDDIAACGADAQAVRHGAPGHATEVMVAYAYDLVNRGNPVGFFGMVHVLEGTSIALASSVAENLAESLGLPATAFRYLTSHGSLDVAHVGFFRELIDGLRRPEDRAAVIHASKRFCRLYGDIFRELQQEPAPCN